MYSIQFNVCMFYRGEVICRLVENNYKKVTYILLIFHESLQGDGDQ
jgi:hypothetical protein